MANDLKKAKPALGLNFTDWERSRRMRIAAIDADEPVVEDDAYVWVRYPANQAPRDGLAYVSDIDGGFPHPMEVTEKAILEDVRVLERSARKLRRFVSGIANHSVEVVPTSKERPAIDEAAREKAKRAVAKSGFTRVTK